MPVNRNESVRSIQAVDTVGIARRRCGIPDRPKPDEVLARPNKPGQAQNMAVTSSYPASNTLGCANASQARARLTSLVLAIFFKTQASNEGTCMGCETHYVDNQGFCHRCGMPMNFDYWLASIGPEAYRNWEQYTDEWRTLISDWKERQNMRCLICGDSDVFWVTTVMQNEDEGYEEYSCNSCRGRSEYGFQIRERKYTGKTNVFPLEVE